MVPTRHTMKITIDDWQYQALRETASNTHKHLAAVVREIISEKLSVKNVSLRSDPLFSIVGMASGDGSSVAEKHDDVLYGEHK